jgi:PQQ-like domain
LILVNEVRMRGLMVLGVLALPLVAGADASLGADAFERGICDYEKGPFQAGRRDPAFKQMGERLQLSFAQATEHRVLFNRGWGLHQLHSVVIDRASGREAARVADEAVALVEDAAGRLAALLAVDADRRELRLLDPATGAVRWHLGQSNRGEDGAAAILDGSQLIIATWSRFATGSRLFAVDFATGAPRWTADVEQLHVAHSEYFNDVVLGLDRGVIALRGLEASGCYLQTFDAATGHRRSSQIKKKF